MYPKFDCHEMHGETTARLRESRHAQPRRMFDESHFVKHHRQIDSKLGNDFSPVRIRLFDVENFLKLVDGVNIGAH